MISFTEVRSSLATATLLAAACLALAGCKTTGKQMPEEESTWINPFEPKTFKEAEAMLPSIPADADLIPFTVNGTGSFEFAVDSKSISVGVDKVVRYTVVIQSRSGARNTTFEGLRCDAGEFKLYATLPKGATEWVPNLSEKSALWYRLDSTDRNAYQATLAREYFCEGHTVAGKAPDIVRALKDNAPRSLYR